MTKIQPNFSSELILKTRGDVCYYLVGRACITEGGFENKHRFNFFLYIKIATIIWTGHGPMVGRPLWERKVPSSSLGAPIFYET